MRRAEKGNVRKNVSVLLAKYWIPACNSIPRLHLPYWAGILVEVVWQVGKQAILGEAVGEELRGRKQGNVVMEARRKAAIPRISVSATLARNTSSHTRTVHPAQLHGPRPTSVGL